MSLTVVNLMDIVLAVFFLFMAARGFRMGLAFQAARLAVLIAAGVVSLILVNITGIPLLFGLFFLIAFVIFLQVVKVVKIVDCIPVIGALDRAGGALAGFLFAFLVSYFLFHFLHEGIPQAVWREWGITKATVNQSYLLQAFWR